MSIKLPGLHTALSVHGGILPAHAKPPVFTEPTQKSCAEPKRRRIWELTGNFHCSIIGTCLTTAELRQILIKILPGASKETDHELHGRAVLLAGKRDIGAKLLQKISTWWVMEAPSGHRFCVVRPQRGPLSDDATLLLVEWRSGNERALIPS